MATSRHRLLLGVVWLVFSGFTASAQAAVEDRPPFFQLDYQGQTAYLLGSIHVGQANFYPMAPLIESKFESAGSLVVEADAASADIMALIRKYGLNKLPIDVETKTVLDAYCKQRASVCATLSGFAPWLQSMQLGMNRFEELGYSAEYGVDQRFIASNQGRPLLELESTEFQFRLLSSFDEKSQWAMVREAIESPDEDMRGLVTAWRTGDAAHIAELMEGQMSDEEDLLMLDKLLWQRNIDMAARIRELMLEPGIQQPLFIIIGAGHLVGARSIPMEMTQHGAKVTSCWQLECD
ncbi:TraB/GumN family protein [Shewanella psychropiezotolerans]|uniref:TraB/GumN family protein n=1 Tax=Shewanella psychropiezotolerans TaxID=2593655 RepID=A0ABX5WT32_9GAMM|nr:MULTISPECIES: TraB/GumN family protein [Shewanella]MPY25932.1 TraB/GumN family protein [Shewanella sp. YLB-07]QDO82254.1 TraB/GumN family protein [Shewanella psychropiezotolerans]